MRQRRANKFSTRKKKEGFIFPSTGRTRIPSPCIMRSRAHPSQQNHPSRVVRLRVNHRPLNYHPTLQGKPATFHPPGRKTTPSRPTDQLTLYSVLPQTRKMHELRVSAAVEVSPRSQTKKDLPTCPPVALAMPAISPDRPNGCKEMMSWPGNVRRRNRPGEIVGPSISIPSPRHKGKSWLVRSNDFSRFPVLFWLFIVSGKQMVGEG
jgi:hypothetical protein